MSLFGCSTLSRTQKAQEHDKANYQVINLGKEFEVFWEKAQGKSFEAQLKIWDEIVEAPHQDVYDTLVYSKAYSKDWQEKKIKRLKEYFADLPQKYEANKRLFDTFENTVAEQIEKFSRKFPDSKFTLKIYAVPGATFNGKSSRLSLFPL